MLLYVNMNRLQVLERLSLGRMVEAEMTPDAEGRRIFLEVRPLIDEQAAELKPADFGIEPLLLRASPNANVIKGYRVRFCSLNPGWESVPDDWDLFVHEQQWFVYDSLDELERALSERFGLLFEALKVPGNTESPW